ncbi:MAG TPA: NADP-dependent oxidoreductase [Mycobacterium sp.]|nr:NADP-dependent oxidoreductase [Mycobacterium sp.]
MSATMTALVAQERGGPEVLALEEVPVPEPAAGEVLVQVHAAAITFDELTWDATWSHVPMTPSHEVSGVVVALGPGVTGPAVGAEVYGLIDFDRNGAAGQYVTVPAGDLAPRPASVSHAEAAAVPLAGLTAWQALVDHAKVQAGERVLVLGAAGGVGAFVVQLAHILGADVTATVRSDVADSVRELGADHVIDVRNTQVDDGGPTYDVVIDTVGGQTLEGAYATVRRGGRLVTLSAPPPAGRADEYGVTAEFFVVTPDRTQLAELARLVDEGRLRVTIAASYPLEQGRRAFESGRQPHRRPGKTILIVRD